MEIYKTKIVGNEVNVIFTGKNYFFHSSYYGVVAIAERTQESFDNLTKLGERRQKFVVSVGNINTLGGSMGDANVFAAAEKFITKNENKYIQQDCEFERKQQDLSKVFLTVYCNTPE